MPSTAGEGTGGGFVDRLKGKAKQLGGALVDDDALKHEGELHEQKADAKDEARRLEAEAAEERDETELVAKERDLAIEQQRLAAEEVADANERRLEREQQHRQNQIDREHARGRAGVSQREQGEKAAATMDVARAARDREVEHREADDAELEAQRARRAAEALERAADRTARE